MSRVVIYPFKMSSGSSKQLKDRLGALRVYPDRNYRPREDDLIINWGNSKVPNWYGNIRCNYLNHHAEVGNASNKLKALEILSEAGVQVPEFTVDSDIALLWDKVVVRHKLTGHSGEGIEIVDGDEHYMPNAPLYTEFIPQKAEYRVHVFNGNVIDISKKVRAEEDEEFLPTSEEMQVRSHQNGWTFARGGIKFNPELGRIAIKSIEALGLDFGAVDIVKGMDGQFYTLEVNTACGMEQTTENSYVNAIMNYKLQNE